MEKNISELAETIYRMKQQSDIVIDMHFARVFKKAILNDHQFYVPIHRESVKKINPLVAARGKNDYLSFLPICLLCVFMKILMRLN